VNRKKESDMELWWALERKADLIKQYILYKWVQNGKPDHPEPFFRTLLEIGNGSSFNYLLDAGSLCNLLNCIT
jgi:hypothetical protein